MDTYSEHLKRLENMSFGESEEEENEIIEMIRKRNYKDLQNLNKNEQYNIQR